MSCVSLISSLIDIKFLISLARRDCSHAHLPSYSRHLPMAVLSRLVSTEIWPPYLLMQVSIPMPRLPHGCIKEGMSYSPVRVKDDSLSYNGQSKIISVSLPIWPRLHAQQILLGLSFFRDLPCSVSSQYRPVLKWRNFCRFVNLSKIFLTAKICILNDIICCWQSLQNKWQGRLRTSVQYLERGEKSATDDCLHDAWVFQSSTLGSDGMWVIHAVCRSPLGATYTNDSTSRIYRESMRPNLLQTSSQHPNVLRYCLGRRSLYWHFFPT